MKENMGMTQKKLRKILEKKMNVQPYASPWIHMGAIWVPYGSLWAPHEVSVAPFGRVWIT